MSCRKRKEKSITATLIHRKSGQTPGYEVRFYDPFGNRVAIYLGGRRYAKKTAIELKEIVGNLVFYRDNAITVPDKKTLAWLEAASPEIRKKLANVGLIELPETHTLGELWDYRDLHKGLGGAFDVIRKQAGLPEIPRPFDNMRATRSNEIYAHFGPSKESEWIGHSARVRADHYDMIGNDDYTEAAGWESTKGSRSVR